MRRYLTIYIVLLSFSIPAFADHNVHLFKKGNEFYELGQYQEAIKNFEEIIDNGYESWELYYNLGNAYFKNKQLGKAILNLKSQQLA